MHLDLSTDAYTTFPSAHRIAWTGTEQAIEPNSVHTLVHHPAVMRCHTNRHAHTLSPVAPYWWMLVLWNAVCRLE